MQFRFSFLVVLLLAFVGLPTNEMRACGAKKGTEKAACCSDSAKKLESKGGCCSKADGGAKRCPCQNCPDHDENGGCHCPGGSFSLHFSAVFSAAATAFLTVSSDSLLLKKRAFYFAERQPEAVYLPIWQPPQLTA